MGCVTKFKLRLLWLCNFDPRRYINDKKIVRILYACTCLLALILHVCFIKNHVEFRTEIFLATNESCLRDMAYRFRVKKEKEHVYTHALHYSKVSALHRETSSAMLRARLEMPSFRGVTPGCKSVSAPFPYGVTAIVIPLPSRNVINAVVLHMHSAARNKRDVDRRDGGVKQGIFDPGVQRSKSEFPM